MPNNNQPTFDFGVPSSLIHCTFTQDGDHTPERGPLSSGESFNVVPSYLKLPLLY